MKREMNRETKREMNRETNSCRSPPTDYWLPTTDHWRSEMNRETKSEMKHEMKSTGRLLATDRTCRPRSTAITQQ
jgi:carbamoylphosphate synthase large subunit